MSIIARHPPGRIQETKPDKNAQNLEILSKKCYIITGKTKGATMAEMKMNDYLLLFYRQLRFNEMPADVRARFDDLAKWDGGNGIRGDFTGNMAEWQRDLVDASDPTGNKELPDPHDPETKLKDEDWKKLYVAFRDALRSMSSKRDELKGEVKEFLDTYYGPGLLFEPLKATDAADTELGMLATVLQNSSITSKLSSGYYNVKPKDGWDKFREGLRNKKYNTDEEFRQQMFSILNTLRVLEDEGQIKPKDASGAPINLNYDTIENGFPDDVDARKLDAFKANHTPGGAPIVPTAVVMLKKVYRPKIYKVFAEHDGGKITGQIDKAKEKVAYDNKDSQDYIEPKHDDKLTPWQQMKKHAGDTYDAVLGKYLSRHGNRVYFSTAARNIVEAIDKAKIKPTDGLDKILSSASTIKSQIVGDSKTSADHFDWFVKTMKKIKDEMPHAFNGALKNGRQLRAVVAVIIREAAKEAQNAKDEKEQKVAMDRAKTAMEVLSVVKYGFTTSKIMDAMRGSEVSIFSDGQLSWNKNEGMKFLTTALDKGIKYAFLAIGYGITMAGNAYHLNGSKFKGKLGDGLKDSYKYFEKKKASARQGMVDDHADERRSDAVKRTGYINDIADANTAGINAGTVDATQANLDRDKSRHDAWRNNLDTRRNDPAFQADVELVSSLQEKDQAIRNNFKQIRETNNKIRRLERRRMDASALTPPDMDVINGLTRNLEDLKLQRDDAKIQRNAAIAEYETYGLTGGTRRTFSMRGDPTNDDYFGPEYKAAKLRIESVKRSQQRLDAQTGAREEMQSKVDKFRTATRGLEELSELEDKRIAAERDFDDNYHDAYRELMAYWDMLETGRDSHTGNMYKWDLFRSNKHAQDNFNADRNAIAQAAINNYNVHY